MSVLRQLADKELLLYVLNRRSRWEVLLLQLCPDKQAVCCWTLCLSRCCHSCQQQVDDERPGATGYRVIRVIDGCSLESFSVFSLQSSTCALTHDEIHLKLTWSSNTENIVKCCLTHEAVRCLTAGSTPTPVRNQSCVFSFLLFDDDHVVERDAWCKTLLVLNNLLQQVERWMCKLWDVWEKDV